MSFAKAVDLLRLAEMATARYHGASLSDIEVEFGVDRRTAQRMTKALLRAFPQTETIMDADRRKYWKIGAGDARMILSQGLRESELTALEMAIRRAERDGAATEVRALGAVRDRLLSAMPPSHARRVEADAEAMLEAHGFASRPGPRERAAPQLLGAIAEALKGPWQLTIAYRGARDTEVRERLVEAHGLLLGARRYLVARPAGGDGRMRHYRLDRIETAVLGAASFARDPGFDLAAHSARAFGSFHAEDEYGDVVWRFSPAAAATARAFVFHPDQILQDEPDGALTVRFMASGHLEMAWHLYQWGDAVEVLAPEPLRQMVARHRRNDFPALP